MEYMKHNDIYEIVDATFVPQTGAIAVHQWGSDGDLDKLKKVAELNGKLSLLITDFDGNNVLHYASYSTAINVCEYIIDLFPDFHFANSFSITPGHIAAKAGNIEVLKILMKSSVLLTYSSQKKWLPLHFAIFYGKIQTVKFLLENQINHVDSLILGIEDPSMFLAHRFFKFCSPYDIAIKLNYIDIALLLYENGALPSLHSAILQHHIAAVTYLVESRFSVLSTNASSLESNNSTGKAGKKHETPMHLAAKFGFYDIAHYLIHNKFSDNEFDINGHSPLELAISSGSVSTVLTLAKISSSEKIAKALFLAADLNQNEVIVGLISKNGCSLPALNDDGDSLLIRFLKRNLHEGVKALLKSEEIDINFRHADSRGATALHYAAAIADSASIDLIYKKFPENSKKKDVFGFTPLMYAVFAGNSQSIAYLSDGDITSKCVFGLTPFHTSYCLLGMHILFSLEQNLIDMKIDIDINKLFSFNENYPLKEKTISIGGKEYITPIANLYAKRLRNIILTPKTFSKFYPPVFKDLSVAHLAAIGNCDTTLSIISTSRPDLFDFKDSEGRKPFFYAACLLHLSSCSLLAKYFDPELNVFHDGKGNTIMHYLTMSDSMKPLVEFLFCNYSLSLSARNNLNETVFHVICKENASGMLLFLISKLEEEGNIYLLHEKSNISAINFQGYPFDSIKDDYNQNLNNKDHNNSNNNKNDTHYNIKKNIDDNTNENVNNSYNNARPYNKGITSHKIKGDSNLYNQESLNQNCGESNDYFSEPIDYAVMNCSINCIDVLHSYGVINRLVQAVISADLQRVRFLLESKYPVNSVDKNGLSALHIAAASNNVEIIEILAKFGANMHNKSPQGLHPIHFAAQNDNYEAICALLKYPYDINLVKVEDQPMLLTKTRKCQIFLFKFWKRVSLTKSLLNLLRKRFGTLCMIRNRWNSNVIAEQREKTKLPFWDSFDQIIDRMIFISDTVLRQYLSKEVNYSISLHHLLLIFTTIDISNYCTHISESIEQLYRLVIETNHEKPNTFLLLLFPLWWIFDCVYLIHEICTVSIETIDETSIIDFIAKSMVKYIDLAKAAVDKCTIVTTRSIPTYSGFPFDFRYFASSVLFVMDATIYRIAKKFEHVLNIQTIIVLKQFFGNHFNLSRTIPFAKGEKVRIALTDKFIIFSSLDKANHNKAYIQPITFFWIKRISKTEKEVGLRCLSPNGAIFLKIALLDSIFYELYKSRLNTIVKYDEGYSALQKKNNTKMFQCLCIYNFLESPSLTVRCIVIKAVHKNNCHDVCKNHIADSLGIKQMGFFVVHAKKLEDQSNDVIVI